MLRCLLPFRSSACGHAILLMERWYRAVSEATGGAAGCGRSSPSTREAGVVGHGVGYEAIRRDIFFRGLTFRETTAWRYLFSGIEKGVE